MKIKIDEDGWLWLERAGKMKSQFCIHCDGDRCGDWCPAFGEPYGTETIHLYLCREVGGALQCKPEDFTDEREEALETDV